MPKAKALRKFHLVLTVTWGILIIPTVMFWSQSILWLGLVSCYANAVGHFAAYEGARAEDSNN